MRALKKLFMLLTLSLCAGLVMASSDKPQNGLDYKTLAKPQPTDAGKKIEVIEFFGYFCPHCNALDPSLTEWVKKQGDKIVFKRVHVLFDPRMLPIQQTYVTLELMGKTEEVHKKIFDGLHKQRLRLDTPEVLLEFVTRQGGIDKQKYLDVYNSFSVQTKLRRSAQLLEAYGITSVPQLFVDGRFQTAPDLMHNSLGAQASEAALHAATMQTLDSLVEMVSRERLASEGGKKK